MKQDYSDGFDIRLSNEYVTILGMSSTADTMRGIIINSIPSDGIIDLNTVEGAERIKTINCGYKSINIFRISAG